MTTHTLHVSSVIVKEGRQRKTFAREDLISLAESIRDTVLINAIVVESLDNPTLIAGERRLRVLTALAAKDIPFRYNDTEYVGGLIPVVVGGDLSPLELQEIELAENLRRTNLTWQEEAAATAHILTLRNERKQEEGLPPVTLKEVAAEQNISHATVSQRVNIAKHLDDPDVAKAKTRKDAEKIIIKKDKEKRRADKASAIDYTSIRHTLLEGDCREQIKQVRTGTMSAIVTDPPYGVNMHKDQSWDGSWHEYDDTEAYAFNLVSSLLPEWDRVCLPSAHLYMFCDVAKFYQLRAIVEARRTHVNGGIINVPYRKVLASYFGDESDDEIRNSTPVFECMYFPFIWDKGNIASYPRPSHWPRKSYECILYAIKGNKEHNGLDLATIPIDQIRDQDHPAGKPTELYQHLLFRSCEAGDQVLDCFAGQGNIFRAAHKLGLTATGIELSPKYLDMAKESLATCK